ncbi:helix-turn-helix domain-containing protein [Amycolatopsis minnesotensis]|uniref:helix-turn-helix domain-containing protein n=1 Tax=Amycolatopsis minnesotensis TaxID=337894 RepID=UPI003CD0676F
MTFHASKPSLTTTHCFPCPPRRAKQRPHPNAGPTPTRPPTTATSTRDGGPGAAPRRGVGAAPPQKMPTQERGRALSASTRPHLVDLRGSYLNHQPGLLEQLKHVANVTSQSVLSQPSIRQSSTTRSQRLRDRFTREELDHMVTLYQHGATASQIADQFGLSTKSVKRLAHQRGVRKTR